MRFNVPKNDDKYFWTNHVGRKMMYYGLSADRVKRVIRSPHRSEKGIAPETIAVMQPGKMIVAVTGKSPSWKEEVWVMYANATNHQRPTTNNKNKSLDKLSVVGSKLLVDNFSSRKIIITAWRYPGKSPIREAIPIPADIIEELKSIKY